ncbi:MAG: bifunctional phosphoserine phosphatase/homoserine phosphotransferase ThrH [Saprospiraceae bacterium]|nr:bifunctional phosphoserine phosphatase/homoserine phosphotransferase ThrH [Saprospiraceae bacterium]
MYIVCSDLEGVFIPEIWINVAEKTGISELRLTTRDISDYDVLMRKRLQILKENHLKLSDIQAVIDTMSPIEGALEFLDWLRTITQVIVVSDTFKEFAGPMMKKLGWPTLFCHSLTIDACGMIASYDLRQQRAKEKTTLAMKSLNYQIIAMGDSYNDIAMLKAADRGLLFRPPENVIREFPEFPVTHDYGSLKELILAIINE